MAKARLRVKKRAELPRLLLPRSFWRKAGQAWEAGIIEGILKQESPKGGRLKTNAKSTRMRKRRKGRPLLSLVDEKHRLVQGNEGSYKIVYLPGGRGIRLEPATDEVKDITKWVTDMGYDFMGISKSAAKAIKEALGTSVRRLFQRAA